MINFIVYKISGLTKNYTKILNLAPFVLYSFWNRKNLDRKHFLFAKMRITKKIFLLVNLG